MIIEGRALKFGNDINTDLIFPARYLTLTKPEELAKCAMVGADPDFPEKIESYGLVVAGRNFGCGSSREHAPRALKYAGVKCVLAESFARIFFRNAINIGLPILECKGVHSEVNENDQIIIDMEKGIVEDRATGKILKAKPFPNFLIEIINDGGLIEHINRRIQPK
jgi:3-isopropylmalate/(R)-2-methylmalate dehydratase small subunit